MITFNSLNFLWFFIIVFSLYWLFPQKFRSLILLFANYIFYASWDFRFLPLLIFSTFANYLCGLAIDVSKSQTKRKFFLIVSVVVNIGILGIFKYFNFFTENLIILLNSVGLNFNFTLLKIILPVGISFYTFQALSYTIDIYRQKIRATKNIITFSVFIAYFPQLVAGPIERASDLIPQINSKKDFKVLHFKRGFYLFIYGLCQKVVIADSVAVVVNTIFASSNPTGANVLIGAYAFAIQIYCDFAGYSNMARGISYFFGMELTNNFNLPYFAKTPADFWTRWHITLSTWVRDYLYIPLGGRKAPFFGLTSLFITMFLMGLWHGAAWNFALWGIFWAFLTTVYRTLQIMLAKVKIPDLKLVRLVINGFLILIMFHLTCYSWILFRSESFEQILTFTSALFAGINLIEFLEFSYLNLYIYSAFLAIYMLMQKLHNDLLFIIKKNFIWQSIFYLVLFFLYIQKGQVVSFPFIYFQF